MISEPIANYVMVSECRSAALMRASGSVDWLCFPRVDSPSGFGRILGEDVGFCSIRPVAPCSWTRRNLGPTMVLGTVHTTAGGTVRITDSMALGVGNLREHELGPGSVSPTLWSQEEITRGMEAILEGWGSCSQLPQSYDGHWRDLVASRGRILHALWVALCPDEAGEFFQLLAAAVAGQLNKGGELQIMYGIGRESDLSERVPFHLPGWRRSAPVRVGNGAWNQRPVDVDGELLDAPPTLPEYFCDVDPGTRRLLAGQTRRARAVVERAAGFATDLGLLSEGAAPGRNELLGNFPPAFSHIGLANAARAISTAGNEDRNRAASGGQSP